MVTDAPPPDVHVDEALAARLVAAQHPDLSGRVRLVANGWDNAVFRLGDEYVVRMPRRAIAAKLVLHEQRWLPELARMTRRVPVRVPAPVRVGRPAPELGFDFPWSILPWFDGVSAADVEPLARAAAARSLAQFVVALAAPAPADAPVNPYRGVPLAVRDESVRERLARSRMSEPGRLGEVWERALAAPEWRGAAVWLHGDLHPANLVLGASGDLEAVVDFGDLCAGDPACDLATAWLTFDAPARAEFRREVERGNTVDEATWDRARGWALVLGSSIVDIVGVEGRLGRVGVHALEQVLAD